MLCFVSSNCFDFEHGSISKVILIVSVMLAVETERGYGRMLQKLGKVSPRPTIHTYHWNVDWGWITLACSTSLILFIVLISIVLGKQNDSYNKTYILKLSVGRYLQNVGIEGKYDFISCILRLVLVSHNIGSVFFKCEDCSEKFNKNTRLLIAHQILTCFDCHLTCQNSNCQMNIGFVVDFT